MDAAEWPELVRPVGAGVQSVSAGLSKREYREQVIVHQRDIALTLSRLVVVLERMLERGQYRD